jgi:hypothetical protein
MCLLAVALARRFFGAVGAQEGPLGDASAVHAIEANPAGLPGIVWRVSVGRWRLMLGRQADASIERLRIAALAFEVLSWVAFLWVTIDLLAKR